MKTIGWTPKALRAFKRLVRQNPQLRPLIEQTLRQLAEDPFHPGLRTHKLAGDLSGICSCSIDHSFRLLFEFVKDAEGKEALLFNQCGFSRSGGLMLRQVLPGTLQELEPTTTG